AMRLLILTAALLVAPAVLLTERLAHHKVHSLAIAGGAAAIAVVVLVRLSGLLRGLERARASERLALREAEQAQHLLRLQNERLRELDHLKSEFVSSVTHELRTPLTSISGYVQLMLEDEPSELKQSYLGIIDRNATRLLALISDILF